MHQKGIYELNESSITGYTFTGDAYMVTGQELVFTQLDSLHKLQHCLLLAKSAASSHTMKSVISDQISKLDQIESLIQILATQRGWEIIEMEPLSRWIISLRFHYRKDPSIAEHLICFYTEKTITMMKQYNRWDQRDQSIQILFQKLMDNCTLGIRQIALYL